MPRERKRYTRAELIVSTTGRFLLAAFLLLVACLLASAAWNMFWRYDSARHEAKTSKLSLEQLTAQDERAKSDVAKLSSGTGLEAALRQRFGVVKPGEGIIFLVSAPTASATSATQPSGFWSKLWHGIFR